MLKQLRPHLTLNNGVLLVALLITVTWMWGTVGAIQQNFVLQQQVDSLSQQIGYQDLENQTLAFENQYYNSNEYLELAARDHLSKANPGEKMLILPSTTASVASTTQQTTTVTIPITKRSNFQQWVYFLFGNKN
jgi:cell division protein FtsB